MKAFKFPGDRQVVIDEMERPKPGVGQVVIATRATAICGTDLHLYRQDKQTRAEAAGFCVGHEPSGEIVEVGEGVQSVKPGDRVVGYHVGGCGQCTACRLRRYKECPRFTEFAMAETRHGANAEFTCLPEGQCLPLPDDFSFEEGAVLACNFGTGYGAMRNAYTFPGGTVAIWGLGPVGLCALLTAKALGLSVIAIDVVQERLDLAEQIGASYVLNGRDDDLVEQIHDLTDGRGADSVVDTSGMPAVHAQLVPSVATRGTVVLVGIGHESAVGPVLWTVLKQIKIVGSWIYDIEDWEDMLGFIRRHSIDLMSVVTEIAAPDDAESVFKRADAAATGKVVFKW